MGGKSKMERTKIKQADEAMDYSISNIQPTPEAKHPIHTPIPIHCLYPRSWPIG